MHFADDQKSQSSDSRSAEQQQDAENEITLQQKLQADVESNLWDYEEVLNILGFGKTHWILLLISGLLTMTSMAAVISPGIISISSQCEFNITQKEKGVMMAACVIGIVFSTYIWGYISDVWGRRTVLLWTMFFTNAMQFITMFVTHITLYNVINLLMGFSLGGILAVIYPYLGEFNNAKYRAVVINYSTMFVSITVIYVPAISWLVLSNDWSFEISETFTFRPWRLIILFSLLPGLIGNIILIYFPESPKLLLAQEKHKEALKALNWVAEFNTGHNLETLLNTSKINLKLNESVDAKIITLGKGCSMISNLWRATVPVFHKPHGVNVTIAIVTIFGLMFASSGMQVWFPEIVNRSAGSQTGRTVCEILDDSFRREHLNVTNEGEDISMICDNTISSKTYIQNMIMGLAFLVGFAVQGVLLNPLGRKNILIAIQLLGGLSGILLYVISNTTGILILFCVYIVMPGLSISIMLGAMVDLVPTHLRGKAVSLSLTLGRLGTIIATNLIAAMLEPYCNGIFGIITCTLLVCGGLVCFLPI